MHVNASGPADRDGGAGVRCVLEQRGSGARSALDLAGPGWGVLNALAIHRSSARVVAVVVGLRDAGNGMAGSWRRAVCAGRAIPRAAIAAVSEFDPLTLDGDDAVRRGRGRAAGAEAVVTAGQAVAAPRAVAAHAGAGDADFALLAGFCAGAIAVDADFERIAGDPAGATVDCVGVGIDAGASAPGIPHGARAAVALVARRLPTRVAMTGAALRATDAAGAEGTAGSAQPLRSAGHATIGSDCRKAQRCGNHAPPCGASPEQARHLIESLTVHDASLA